MNTPIQRVAVIGTGVIGASWATLFLARGLHVRAFDTAPRAERDLRDTVERQWPAMQALGISAGGSPDQLTFCSSIAEALDGVQFVQESGPERLEFKRDLFAEMGAATAADTVLASSTSSLRVSDFQNAAAHPQRVVLGHPFNPPHLIPLVEVGGGDHTAQAAIVAAKGFYASCGKRPIELRREVRGHIANRLQAALWQEAFHLVESGVATVNDIDEAIAHGPGLRWALLGPFLTMHLSGGRQGMPHVLSHLGPAMESIWRDLGKITLSRECRTAVLDGLNEEIRDKDLSAITTSRDELLIELLKSKKESDLP